MELKNYLAAVEIRRNISMHMISLEQAEKALEAEWNIEVKLDNETLVLDCVPGGKTGFLEGYIENIKEKIAGLELQFKNL